MKNETKRLQSDREASPQLACVLAVSCGVSGVSGPEAAAVPVSALAGPLSHPQHHRRHQAQQHRRQRHPRPRHHRHHARHALCPRPRIPRPARPRGPGRRQLALGRALLGEARRVGEQRDGGARADLVLGVQLRGCGVT